MKNYSKESFVNKLRELEWSNVTNINDNVNEALQIFNTMLTEAIDHVAPKKDIRIRGRTEPWMNDDILAAIRDRDRALFYANRYKNNTEYRSAYTNKRNRVANLIKGT